MNIVETIRTEAAALAGKTAVIDGDRTLSYADLFPAVDAARDALTALGVSPGQRIAFLCNDGADYIVASLAILSIPAAIAPISPSLTPEEAGQVLERIDVHGLLFDAGLPAPTGTTDDRPASIPGRTAFRFARRTVTGSVPPEHDALNAAFIRFSSGTTGDSKGVLLSHETIIERTSAADKGLAITQEDTVLWVLSMSYHFVVSILLFLRRGAAIVICREDLPLALAEGVTKHGGTFIYASPFHYYSLTQSHEVPSSCLADVRLAISTAVALPPDVAGAFRDKFGMQLTSAYGIIEVGLPFINTMPGEKPGSVGPALPDYDVLIADPDADGVGRILLRGPGMFDAYCSPWQSRDDVLKDGWFDTGDVGRLDKDACLFILGRDKNVINFAGMKVFPYEVEEVIDRHPSVAESLVYAQDHPQYGQLPCARVVIDPRAEGPVSEIELRRHCARHLAPFKVPKEFAFADRLERTASGKLRRRSFP